MADLWHTLMTGILGHDRYAAGGCDVGALVTGQLGHKYAGELYGINIGSGLKLTLFNGDRAWDLSGGRPIPDGLPAEIRAQVVALEKRFAVHLAVARPRWPLHPVGDPRPWVDDLRRTFRGRR